MSRKHLMKARRLIALLGIFDNINLKLQAKFLLEKNNIGSKNNDSLLQTCKLCSSVHKHRGG